MTQSPNITSLLPPQRSRTVTAILGSTNTGKTHLAIERMLGHETGIIGLPLRLLAREVYGRIIERIPADQVALVTGEEKSLPPDPRYWVCTVEAMPRDVQTDFLAIDEIQLAGDLSRGHVFTDRILNMRGNLETLLLGAQTIRPLIEKLLPGVNIVTRPRLSALTYNGARKITRLPARSAIIAFSSGEVYEIAELVRRRRGAAAVVLGSLSPRTRNAQVALFQSGDVDYLVATDAIGMGLNLDLDHVAFASDEKFDGFQRRKLNPAEIAQIAGRAGRHTRDGTFGVTGKTAPFSESLVDALQSHRLQPLKILQWRNRDYAFSSVSSLQTSLDIAPSEAGLIRAPLTDDASVLIYAAENAQVLDIARGPAEVSLLWDVCQIPDYRKIAPANHGDLIISLFLDLARLGHIDEDWFAQQVAFADKVEGNIDALSNKIAHIRTWTYIANRNGWLNDPEHWRQRTRDVEDRLSDALHQKLLEKFVDRRTSVLMKRLRENEMLSSEVTSEGEVLVEGEPIGRLAGFRFSLHSQKDVGDNDARTLKAAAARVLSSEIEARVEKFYRCVDGEIALTSGGNLRWRGDVIASIGSSDDFLQPNIIVLGDELLIGPLKDKVEQRLKNWVGRQIDLLLKPLVDLKAAEGLDGLTRGLAYRLYESQGVLARSDVADEVRQIDQESRGHLRRLGVRFGAYHIFVPQLLKPIPSRLIAELWSANSKSETEGVEEICAQAFAGRTSMPVDPAIAEPLYRITGYALFGLRAVRIDILERLGDEIRPLLAWRPKSETPKPEGVIDQGGAFKVTASMMSLLGCSGEDFPQILGSLGFRMGHIKVPAPEKTTDESQVKEEQDVETSPNEDAGPVAAEVAPNDGETGQQEMDPAADRFDGDLPDSSDQPELPRPEEEAFIEIEIWRPSGRSDRKQTNQRQARARKENSSNTVDKAQERNKKRGQKRSSASGNRDGKSERSSGYGKDFVGKQKKPEKALDPDSPFAALAALKESLGKKK